jgi:hypothetical protein
MTPLHLVRMPGTSGSPLLALSVKIEHATACCSQPAIAMIGISAGPHFAELKCTACGAHRGWLSKRTAEMIEAIITKFGRPAEPIVIRR